METTCIISNIIKYFSPYRDLWSETAASPTTRGVSCRTGAPLPCDQWGTCERGGATHWEQEGGETRKAENVSAWVIWIVYRVCWIATLLEYSLLLRIIMILYMYYGTVTIIVCVCIRVGWGGKCCFKAPVKLPPSIIAALVSTTPSCTHTQPAGPAP